MYMIFQRFLEPSLFSEFFLRSIIYYCQAGINPGPFSGAQCSLRSARTVSVIRVFCFDLTRDLHQSLTIHNSQSILYNGKSYWRKYYKSQRVLTVEYWTGLHRHILFTKRSRKAELFLKIHMMRVSRWILNTARWLQYFVLMLWVNQRKDRSHGKFHYFALWYGYEFELKNRFPSASRTNQTP